MAKVTLLLCALLIVALIQQGKGCIKTASGDFCDLPNCPKGRQLPLSDYSFNYSEMFDGIKHPGLMSALKAYDTDKDGIISGEGEIDTSLAMIFSTI